MKKIVILVSLILFSTNFANGAFAYENNILSGQAVYRNASKYGQGGSEIGLFVDGKESTSATLSGKMVWIKLKGIANISSYQMNIGSIATKNVTLTFYDVSGNAIYSTRVKNTNNSTINIVKNVRGISLINNNTTEYLTIYEMGVFGEYISFDNVSVDHETTYKTVSLKWKNPQNEYFSALKIYRDGVLLKTLNKTETSFIDDSVNSSTTYVYKITAVYGDYETTGITKNIKTNDFIPLKDVADITADADYNRVNLSWNLPDSSEFHHVNIYRDEVDNPSFFESLFLGISVSAANQPTKIFETNGTYFNDLTVQPDTIYEYKLTTQDTSGSETDGESVEVATLEEPKPQLAGADFEEQNGSYLITWTTPTTGKIKILIAENEYKTVDATLKEYSIPKVDMKYTALGAINVKLIPVGEYGTEGDEFKLNDESRMWKIPFDVSDLLESSVGVLWILAPFVLLGLTIVLFKPLKNLIVKAVRKRNERSLER